MFVCINDTTLVLPSLGNVIYFQALLLQQHLIPDQIKFFFFHPVNHLHLFPGDVNTQLLATPDNYLIMTEPFGLVVFKDNGDHATQTGSNLFGELQT